MFTVQKISASRHKGKDFYMDHLSANDYYSRDGKIIGTWNGALTECFNLEHMEVTREVFSSFQQNKNPLTGERLTCRTNKNGIRFFDAQCSAEKSVSIMSMFDDRLVVAHRDAVKIAMDELEKFAAVRIRQGGNNGTYNYETTGKLLYATFHHNTSRSLDPQLHAHQVICNFTLDSAGNFKALQEYEMIRFSSYFGRIYQNEMQRKCRELGYETVPTYDFKGNVKGFEIAGISDELIEKYSSRTREMDAVISEREKVLGRPLTAVERHDVAIETRGGMATMTDSEARQLKLSRLSENEIQHLQHLYASSLTAFQQDIPQDMNKKLEEVIAEIFERDSVVTEADIYAKLLAKFSGVMSLEALKTAVAKTARLIKLDGRTHNPYVTVPEIIEAEKYAIEAIQQGKKCCEPFSPGTEDSVIQGILNSRDQFILLRGAAGAGKTTSLRKLCEQISEEITVLAPTNSAVSVLKSEGFKSATTVSAFLQERYPACDGFLIVDEAGLCSLKTGCTILQTAREYNMRVLFVGDSRQHKSVETGDFFRLLEGHSTIEQFSLSKIYRQKEEEYRQAIQFAADGSHRKSFETLDVMGNIHEHGPDYLQKAAENYFRLTENGKRFNSTILVAPTHAEADRLTDSIREKLLNEGVLTEAPEIREVFRSAQWGAVRLRNIRSYRPGMSLMFIQNKRGIGEAGEVVTIEHIRNKTLTFSNGKSVRLSEIKDFIAVGERKILELREGDLIQFTVNRKKEGIINSGLARIIDNGQIQLLNEKMEPVANGIRTLAPEFHGFGYGWVTTSHKSQGRTADHVVVAAKQLDKAAFYVSASRGRYSADVYCPDKEYFRYRLLKGRERLNVKDVQELPPKPEKQHADPEKARKDDISWKESRQKMKAEFERKVQEHRATKSSLDKRYFTLKAQKTELETLLKKKKDELTRYVHYQRQGIAGKLKIMISTKNTPKPPEGIEDIRTKIQEIEREMIGISRESYHLQYPKEEKLPELRPLETPRKLLSTESPIKDSTPYSKVERNLLNYAQTGNFQFYTGTWKLLKLDHNAQSFMPSFVDDNLQQLKQKPQSPSQFRSYKKLLGACIKQIKDLYPAAKEKYDEHLKSLAKKKQERQARIEQEKALKQAKLEQQNRLEAECHKQLAIEQTKQDYRQGIQYQLDPKSVAYYTALQYHLQANYDKVKDEWFPAVKDAFKQKHGYTPEQQDFPSFPPPAGLNFDQFQQ